MLLIGVNLIEDFKVLKSPVMENKATNEARKLLQATVDGLTVDQVQGINDGLRCYEESLMTTKDRTALLQYWVAVSKRNVGFRDWLAIQLHSIDGPRVATAFEQLTTGALETCADDTCCKFWNILAIA